MNLDQFEGRKQDHIRHALDPRHQAEGLSGLDRVRLIHEALPELNLSDVTLATNCLGETLATPFYVAGMTAGHADAARINQTLARACAKRGWAMGVGSQRRELDATAADLDQWKRLRDEAPSLTIFANIGLSQLPGAPVARLRALADSLQAQALAVHANALQEALQPEGTPNFAGGLEALRRVAGELGRPVILKETGCGFSRRTLERLAETGVAAIDVSGLGGTHWGRIEGARAATGSVQARAARTFEGWGQSTVEATLAASEVFRGRAVEVWASGGVRSGLGAAKLLALGAQRVGYAKPALEAALAGEERLSAWMELQEYELRVALFCTGCSNPAELRQREGMIEWKNSAD
jgi:isopentenyl-diphosphate delta-isomerase